MRERHVKKSNRVNDLSVSDLRSKRTGMVGLAGWLLVVGRSFAACETSTGTCLQQQRQAESHGTLQANRNAAGSASGRIGAIEYRTQGVPGYRIAKHAGRSPGRVKAVQEK